MPEQRKEPKAGRSTAEVHVGPPLQDNSSQDHEETPSLAPTPMHKATVIKRQPGFYGNNLLIIAISEKALKNASFHPPLQVKPRNSFTPQATKLEVAVIVPETHQ